MTGGNPSIHLALRFHGNFYHSYRGDTPDELGFGKDIRIIRRIVESLDALNDRGVPVCGTWDLENYFSLETIMPKHCPDLVEGIRDRVEKGCDEIEIMSYNNGLVSAHTAREFEEAMTRAVTNDRGSGVKDIFGAYAPVVRPQEMMYTPSFLKLFSHYGFEAVSLYYSSIPFNTFSNFVPRLSLVEQHNPLVLSYPDFDETLTLLPAYNNGDILDNISLRRWVRRLRREQLKLEEPVDLLLLIDVDADDDFWWGYEVPVISKLNRSLDGITGLVESVASLDYVTFTTPYRYLQGHEPAGTIVIGQDTADGSFDGLSSWAEKWSNQQLWTGIDRSRILELQARRLAEENTDNNREIDALLGDSFEDRLKSFSTTHFGMASPVMNVTRLHTAYRLVSSSVEKARQAYDRALAPWRVRAGPDEILLIDYTRGISTDAVQYEPRPSRSLVRLGLKGERFRDDCTLAAAGAELPGALFPAMDKGERELLFIADMAPGQVKKFRLQETVSGAVPENPVALDGQTISNRVITLEFDGKNQCTALTHNGKNLSAGRFTTTGITYAGKRREVESWTETGSGVAAGGLVGYRRFAGEVRLDSRGEKVLSVEREYLLAAGLPYLYLTVRVVFPETLPQKFKKGRAVRLEQQWDGNWHEVMPCELAPAIFGSGDAPVRVWKQNHAGFVSRYDLDYGRFSRNREVDSINNHVTWSWAAVSNGEQGLLVAQSADYLTSLAFCNLRTRLFEGTTRVFLNPFGSYFGSQLNYMTANTGIGKAIALQASDHLDPYAPSYNGREQRCSLLIAPYGGDEPPEDMQNDALAFTCPGIVISGEEYIKRPPHVLWRPPGHHA